MTKQTYKVGDKVRILNVDGIMFGDSKWKNGDETLVTTVYGNGDIRLKINRGKNRGEDFIINACELKYIGKVAEDVAKFNVGDKVRVIAEGAAGLDIGTEAVVTNVDSDGDVFLNLRNKYGGKAFYYAHKVELIDAKSTQDKPTKNQRLTALEQQAEQQATRIAALEAEVATLKAAQSKPAITVDLSPNARRAAIIAEAKAFVEDVTAHIIDDHTRNTKYGRLNDAGYNWKLRTFFEVKPEKREVTVVLKKKHADSIVTRGIAKCAPDDVFNADIGKAIALGRALGLDVSRFEQAVKPTEVVVGMVVENRYEGVHKVFAVRPTHRTHGEGKGGDFLDSLNEGYTYINERDFEYWTRLSKVERITDDTEAQYGV